MFSVLEDKVPITLGGNKALGQLVLAKLVRRLAVHHPDAAIAGILNRQGRTSARGQAFSDRWTVLNLTGAGGGVRVRHVRNGRTVTLPAGYVATATELGYASTVHTAQGVTADTMHGVVTGEESRQQLYTMLTRGRSANHIYVSVVGDGDPHTLIRPDTILPSTATELLEQILARDGSPRSASTLLRDQEAPAVRLGESVARYLDALHMAAENLINSSAAQAVETSANQLLPGLSDEPAWPTLRGHLLLLAAAGADPVAELLTAAAQWDLTSA